jgi:lysophospholipase L1-like esterase
MRKKAMKEGDCLMDGEAIQQKTSLGARPNWVGAWYAAPMRLHPAGLTRRTLRQIVHLHAGGRQIRLRLSNRYGEASLTLTSVSVGRVLFGLLVQEPSRRTVLFEGQETVSLEPGAERLSDPIDLPVEAFSKLAITFAVEKGDILTGHFVAMQTSYVSMPGDQSALTQMEELLPAYPLLTTAWWALIGVEVLPEQPLRAVVAFGDSTTDGYGSTRDLNRRWPNNLARRMASAREPGAVSVLNAGISFNELLTSRTPLAGEAAVWRFSWDVLEQTGVTDVLVQIGINDLRHDVAASSIIDGLQSLATQAQARQVRIFGTTVLPAVYTPSQAEQWQRVNTWLREQGADWFDAVFDFASALQHPAGGAKLDPACDSGDGTHPNDRGYQRLAETVDLALLTGNPPDKSERSKR